ncbi:MAG: PAS domain-containing protein [Rhizobiaceae bacterium]|nr:PAS domain-containing protein [Rhizobiaceae bacterium]
MSTIELSDSAAKPRPLVRERDPILAQALRNAGIIVLYQDTTLSFTWAEAGEKAWWEGSLIGRTDHDILPDTDCHAVVEAKRRCLQTGAPERLEIRVSTSPPGPRWFELWIDPDKTEAGDTAGLVTTAVEITEMKHREQTLRALLREVSHRSRNLLAIIQGIASQTGRYSQSVDSFLERFRGRLQSLAESQDLVTSSNWRGAELRDLLAGQVRRYVANPAASIKLEGSNPYLNPNAALHIGLALHELVVNSISFGALSVPNGVVRLRVALHKETGALDLTWEEAVPPGSSAVSGRFGSVALQRVVPASLNGEASLELAGDILVYHLSIPAGGFEAH